MEPSTSEPSEAAGHTVEPKEAHPHRAAVLGELHARPFEPMSAPRRAYHFAYMTDTGEAQRDRETLTQLCRTNGVAPPAEGAKFHSVDVGDWRLRWEQHAEFTTYSWTTGLDADTPFAVPDLTGSAAAFGHVPPGPLLVATHLNLLAGGVDWTAAEGLFHRPSLCMIEAEDGQARIATDFQPDALGFTRILVEVSDLNETGIGALVQRLLEIETYRTLALLGLPEAQRVTPFLRQTELRLAELTREISTQHGVDANRDLLKRLTDMAAEVEAHSAEISYRLAASRAYDAIVQARLTSISERRIPGYWRISSFFRRRLAPAIETCATVDRRQNTLSEKLMRTAELLRTRIQFELEEQNRNLLRSMNRRARLQLRLQQTVEGLSVAAITYYVVGLVGYLAKGAKDAGLAISPAIATAAAVPIVAVAVWWIVHRIRHKFTKSDEH